MSKQTSEFLKAFGVALEIFKAVSNAVLNRKGSDEHLRKVIKYPELADKIAELIIDWGEEKTTEVQEVIKKLPFTIEGKVEVPVNYNQSFDQARDASCQDYVNPSIKLDRIIEGAGYEQKDLQETVQVEIAHFGKYIESEDADKAIDEAGYRHATPAEVFAYACTGEGKAFQKKFWMVSLATKFRYEYGYPCVLGMDVDGGRRRLDLSYWGGGWGDDCRFLVVRKSPSA